MTATEWKPVPVPLIFILRFAIAFGIPRLRSSRSRVEAMASLLPLLYDLLPIIMPSEVQVSHERDMQPIPERAEGPPYHQTQRNDAQVHLGSWENKSHAVPRSSDDPEGFQVESAQGSSCEPIQLLDREEGPAVQSPSEPDRPAPSAHTSGPKVFRRDAMMGVTDKMCATG